MTKILNFERASAPFAARLPHKKSAWIVLANVEGNQELGQRCCSLAEIEAVVGQIRAELDSMEAEARGYFGDQTGAS
jgi:hypothetical protein